MHGMVPPPGAEKGGASLSLWVASFSMSHGPPRLHARGTLIIATSVGWATITRTASSIHSTAGQKLPTVEAVQPPVFLFQSFQAS